MSNTQTVPQEPKAERETITTNITLDAELWREVKKAAIDRRTTAIAIVEAALRAYLGIAEPKGKQ